MELFNNLRHKYKLSTIVEKFIYINIAAYIVIFLFNTFGFLFQIPSDFIVDWLVLPASFDEFVSKPWTIITYGFIHLKFLHILSNLIALFFIGNLFVEYFTPKQFITFYLLGTVFGGLVFLLSYAYFPVFSFDVSNSVLLGASAGVSAIFVGIATYMPHYQIKIPLIGFVKLWYLAAIWIVLDVIQIPVGNAGGHLSHIGGAIFGFVYVNQASNKKIGIWQQILSMFKSQKKPLKTVYKTKVSNNTEPKKAENQQKIDSILEKISKSGYDALTKSEKEFLFRQSNKSN